MSDKHGLEEAVGDVGKIKRVESVVDLKKKEVEANQKIVKSKKKVEKTIEPSEVYGLTELPILIREYGIRLFTKDTDKLDIINSFLETNQTEDAFYIINLASVIQRYEKWQKFLPRIVPYYAVKCNPDSVILQILAFLGACFDVASKNEIIAVSDLDVTPDRIIFANPVKFTSHIKFAKSQDVDMMTFDTPDELFKVKLYHPRAKLVLRIKTDDKDSVCKFSCKFGCDLAEVESLLMLAKTLELNVIGVSFHVGSNCGNPQQYASAIRDARTTFDIAEKLGIKMTLLDIGGGFSDREGEKITFEETARIINESLDEYFPNEDIRIIAEPGRYMVEASHILVFSVVGKKKIVKDGEIMFRYFMNDGVYGSFNCIFFDHAKPLLVPFSQRSDKKYPSVCYGPTCDSVDLINSTPIMLPELSVGDVMFVENFGAYVHTKSAVVDFNGFSGNKSQYILTH